MLQQSSESFTALNWCVGGLGGLRVGRKWDDVADALVRPFDVVVLDLLCDGVPQHRLAEEDYPVGAFLFDRSDEAFGEGERYGDAIRFNSFVVGFGQWHGYGEDKRRFSAVE